MVRLLILVLPLACPSFLRAQDAAPRSLDPEIKIELFAEDPQIVTPTGVDVDHQGRVWAIESNTHFRPKDYKGHPSDRVLVMSDSDGDGRCDRIVPFADGLTHAMSVAVRPVWLAPASGGREPPGSSGGQKSEVRGQRSEVRSQRSETKTKAQRPKPHSPSTSPPARKSFCSTTLTAT